MEREVKFSIGETLESAIYIVGSQRKGGKRFMENSMDIYCIQTLFLWIRHIRKF